MKRKTLLSIVGAGATAIASLGSYLAYQASFTSAEREIKDFPARIKGARAVDKYPVKDAQHVLVHIRQKHMLPFEAQEGDEESGKAIAITCQRDIYTILDSRIKSGKLSEVYSEGLTKEYEKTRNTISPEQKARMLALNEQQRKSFYDMMFLSGGAAQVIALERQIPIRAAESLELNKAGLKEVGEARERSLEAVKKLDDTLNEENLRIAEEALDASKRTLDKYAEPREDYALSSVAESLQRENKTFGYLVYGGGHDFRDNVERWNKGHPKDRFSLIVITPNSYREDN